MDLHSDDVAGEDIEHHVAVEIFALDRAGQFRDVPGVNLSVAGGDQFEESPVLDGGPARGVP